MDTSLHLQAFGQYQGFALKPSKTPSNSLPALSKQHKHLPPNKLALRTFYKSKSADDFKHREAVIGALLSNDADAEVNIKLCQQPKTKAGGGNLSNGVIVVIHDYIDKEKSIKKETWKYVVVEMKLVEGGPMVVIRKPAPSSGLTDDGSEKGRKEKKLALEKVGPKMEVIQLTLYKHGSKPKLMLVACGENFKKHVIVPIGKAMGLVKVKKDGVKKMVGEKCEKIRSKVKGMEKGETGERGGLARVSEKVYEDMMLKAHFKVMAIEQGDDEVVYDEKKGAV